MCPRDKWITCLNLMEALRESSEEAGAVARDLAQLKHDRAMLLTAIKAPIAAAAAAAVLLPP